MLLPTRVPLTYALPWAFYPGFLARRTSSGLSLIDWIVSVRFSHEFSCYYCSAQGLKWLLAAVASSSFCYKYLFCLSIFELVSCLISAFSYCRGVSSSLKSQLYFFSDSEGALNGILASASDLATPKAARLLLVLGPFIFGVKLSIWWFCLFSATLF